MGGFTTSIIILTKNRAQLLRKNLSRLAKQTLRPSEIVIIDNNSTDQTSQVISKYSRLLPIKSFKTKASGYSKLYNLGIKNARSELICFLDDDCLAEKKWLEKLIEAHKKYPDCVIQGQTFSLPKNNIYAEIMGDHYQNWLKSNLINDLEMRTFDNKNATIPKWILDKYGGFSEKQGIGSEDIELGIRLRKKGIRIIFTPEAIAWHHERDNLKDFIKQHYRIAAGEATVDQKLVKEDKIGLFPPKKTWLNLKSGVSRQLKYLIRGKIRSTILLPFLYFLLFCIRIFGYLKKSSFN